MARFPSIIALGLLAGGVRGAEAPVIHVITTDGKPVAGAKVWLSPQGNDWSTDAEPPALTSDAAGTVALTTNESKAPFVGEVFVSDTAGRLGYGYVSEPMSRGSDAGETAIAVLEFAKRTGRVVDITGKPIAGVTLTPVDYVPRDHLLSDVDERLPRRLGLAPWQQKHLRSHSDADGRFALLAPKMAYHTQFTAEAEGFGKSVWYAHAGAAIEMTLLKPGTAAVTIQGVEPKLTKDLYWRVVPQLRQTSGNRSGVVQVRYGGGRCSGEAVIRIENLAPGRYEFATQPTAATPVVLTTPVQFDVATASVTALAATFRPAARVTGRVVDPITGTGVPGVAISGLVRNNTNDRGQHLGTVTTAADGGFAIYGPAGWYVLHVGKTPSGYCPPRFDERRQGVVEPVEVALGKAHEYPPIPLERTVTLAGKVVCADGKPAIAAEVFPGKNAFDIDTMAKSRTDVEGRFAITEVPRDDGIRPHVRLGKAVNVPVTLDLGDADKPVTITIAEANAAMLSGRVENSRGQPLADVKVGLWQRVEGVGRQQRYSMTRLVGEATTDRAGRYEFTGLWPTDIYDVRVASRGFATVNGQPIRTEAGKTASYPTLHLMRNQLSLTGQVVDGAGRPVAGVALFSPDGPRPFHTQSDANGQFTLTGFYEAAGFIFAKGDGQRMAVVPVHPNEAKPITVRMTPASAPPPRPPSITAEHRAAEAKLTRHLLTRIWKGRVDTGFGTNALQAMAKFDIATARRWRDEELQRTDGKNDWKSLIDAAERGGKLIAVAQLDIDEALALVPSGNSVGQELQQLGEALLPLDRAKAARVAEEATVRARATIGAKRVMALAAAGDLAFRAGQRTGGKAVLLEAANHAEQLGATGDDADCRGCVAARLAPLDWPRAEKLLESLKDSRTYNRYLINTAYRLAPVELAATKQLLTRFRPDHTHDQFAGPIMVAVALARDRPADALALVQGIPNGVYRATGYLRLATATAAVDQNRAFGLLDTALTTCEGAADDFRGWSSSGGQAGFGMLCAYRGREIGHPDVRGLIDRALALRSISQATADEREAVIVRWAGALAMIDPATARQLLDGIGTPEEYLTKAMQRDRIWLFTLALTDPERAVQLVDRQLAAAKPRADGTYALRDTGLVELMTILTSRDRFKEMRTYGSTMSDEVHDE